MEWNGRRFLADTTAVAGAAVEGGLFGSGRAFTAPPVVEGP
ncbi:hypothetical protein PYK79_54045 [Streptomyces sp. ID05-04B]|nr:MULTISPECIES: hypothetical protein [unclassified Streptomyces]MDX5570434.1 hypothetical protein [Streptomyces sp. ID05-04B]